jgi:hypothetical protein
VSRKQIRTSLPPDPFEGIGVSPELNALHARIIGPEDASFLADVEAKLRQDCPPIELAMLMVSYVAPAVVRLLGPAAQNMLQSDGTMSPSVREELGRRVISIAQAIEADITEGIDPYPMLAQKTVCYACSRLRTEIQRVAGNTPVVFGTVVQTLYLASSGDASDYYVQSLGVRPRNNFRILTS